MNLNKLNFISQKKYNIKKIFKLKNYFHKKHFISRQVEKYIIKVNLFASSPIIDLNVLKKLPNSEDIYSIQGLLKMKLINENLFRYLINYSGYF